MIRSDIFHAQFLFASAKMTIVRKCCGINLRNRRFWLSVGITIGCLTFAGSTWLTYEIFFTSEPELSNVGEFVKFVHSRLLFIIRTSVKEAIVKSLSGKNLQAMEFSPEIQKQNF